jgi:hypothetical protein
MSVALTKMSVLREAIGVEDLVSMIFDMDVKSTHTDMLTCLRQYLVNMRSGVFKLMRVSRIYFCIVRMSAVSSEEEIEKLVWSKARTNKVVMDVIRDIPYLARSSRSAAEFRVKLLEHYGRSGFLCGVAHTYMGNACNELLPPLPESDDEE